MALSTLPILSALVLTPLAAAAVSSTVPAASRAAACGAAGICLAMVLAVVAGFDPTTVGPQLTEIGPGSLPAGASWHLAVDGLSLWFAVCAVLTHLAGSCGGGRAADAPRTHRRTLVLLSAASCVFLARDGLLLFCAVELFFLVARRLRGPSPRRALVSVAGSAALAGAALLLHGKSGGLTSLAELEALTLSHGEQALLLVLLAIGLVPRAELGPWCSANTPGAGMPLAVGAYLALRLGPALAAPTLGAAAPWIMAVAGTVILASPLLRPRADLEESTLSLTFALLMMALALGRSAALGGAVVVVAATGPALAVTRVLADCGMREPSWGWHALPLAGVLWTGGLLVLSEGMHAALPLDGSAWAVVAATVVVATAFAWVHLLSHLVATPPARWSVAPRSRIATAAAVAVWGAGLLCTARPGLLLNPTHATLERVAADACHSMEQGRSPERRSRCQAISVVSGDRAPR